MAASGAWVRVGGISASLDLYVKRILEVAINVLRKKRGRPATGQDHLARLPVGLRNDSTNGQSGRTIVLRALKQSNPLHRVIVAHRRDARAGRCGCWSTRSWRRASAASELSVRLVRPYPPTASSCFNRRISSSVKLIAIRRLAFRVVGPHRSESRDCSFHHEAMYCFRNAFF